MWYDAAMEVSIMPGKSPFIIDLTLHEKHVLETEARRYTSPYRDVIRSKIILLAAQGYDNDEISSRLDTPRQIVSKWRKRFYYERLLGLQDQPRGGRPGSFPPGSDHRS
ncbi:MAG: helix-turn-helix domain-containing protein [Bacillota bacterium]